MAYDRYDSSDESPRWRDSRDRPHQSGRGEERGFFERAGDEIASWFGDDRSGRGHDERMGGDHRGHDHHRHDHDHRGWSPDRERSQNRDYDRGYGRDASRDRQPPSQDHGREESYRGTSWPSSERDYNPSWRNELGGRGDQQRQDEGNRGYRPMTGDYGRSEQMSGSNGGGDWNRGRGHDDHRERSNWARDDYRSTSRAGSTDQSDRSRDHDPHYRSWREQHMNELDRDYADYHRENRSKFESDFSSWRERRTQKRGLLGQIREHMDVVGNDDKHVGKVDKVAGDRVILAKSDPDSGGAHHSLSCSNIDRIEGDKVILDCSADQARKDWRDESRSRALFEREDQGEMGSQTLNRAFEGTYR